MRPAEVCGLAIKPNCSNSAITLRTVADEIDKPEFAINACEPTGVPWAMYW